MCKKRINRRPQLYCLMRLEINTYEDILRLEARIRELLRCEGKQCAFLQSLPYKSLHMSLLLRLNRVISHDAERQIPMGNGLVLSLNSGASAVEIQQQAEDASPLPPAKTKHKRPPAEEEAWAQSVIAVRQSSKKPCFQPPSPRKQSASLVLPHAPDGRQQQQQHQGQDDALSASGPPDSTGRHKPHQQ